MRRLYVDRTSGQPFSFGDFQLNVHPEAVGAGASRPASIRAIPTSGKPPTNMRLIRCGRMALRRGPIRRPGRSRRGGLTIALKPTTADIGATPAGVVDPQRRSARRNLAGDSTSRARPAAAPPAPRPAWAGDSLGHRRSGLKPRPAKPADDGRAGQSGAGQESRRQAGGRHRASLRTKPQIPEVHQAGACAGSGPRRSPCGLAAVSRRCRQPRGH